jgi:hypothetical protein
VLLQYKDVKGVTVLSDATGYGIIKYILQDVADGKVKHIIIPDFLRILMKGKQVANDLVATLNSLSEEGFMSAFTYNIQFITSKPLTCGFITAITDETYSRQVKKWIGIGFASRIIPFFFGYESEDLEKAKDMVAKEKKVFHSCKLPIPSKPKKIGMSDTYRAEVKDIADFVSKINNDFTAFRTIRNAIGLVKAHALLNERKHVDETDIVFLNSLVPFWFNPTLATDCHYHILRILPQKFEKICEILGKKYSKSTVYRGILTLKDKGVVTKTNGIWHSLRPIYNEA